MSQIIFLYKFIYLCDEDSGIYIKKKLVYSTKAAFNWRKAHCPRLERLGSIQSGYSSLNWAGSPDFDEAELAKQMLIGREHFNLTRGSERSEALPNSQPAKPSPPHQLPNFT
jgi:hypothetical protein